MEKIIVKNAYENNLKHIDVDIQLNAFTCITGCSGCGKSSLVFDTIYAESQRNFLEGMTGNIYGQKLMNKPKVTAVENLRPALNVSQNYYNVNPRSTIGTVTEISYYLRSLFAIVNSTSKDILPENMFSANNPKCCCSNCAGVGRELVISEDLLIPDITKTLKDGGIVFFKGSPDGKEQATLRALCEYYNIDINKRIMDLSNEEKKILLYAKDNVQCRISYKEGKRKKTHYVVLQGAITEINEKAKVSSNLASNGIYAKYVEEKVCHVCNGAKLKPEVLSYKVNGLNYYEIERMELTKLDVWLSCFNQTEISKSKMELIQPLIESMRCKINSLIKLNTGYLCLSRTIPTLSGGERQRVRIATQLTCSLKGLIYILDEPCKGLHYRDIESIVNATKELVNKGNTVIAIEHNKQYMSSADAIIELGPVGGPEGGYIINELNHPAKYKYELNFRTERVLKQFFELRGVSARNVRNENIKFPGEAITCITGVSGSGKSTIASVIKKCFERKNSIDCNYFSGVGSIEKVVEVNQSPIGKTPRSTVASYLEIYDEIRTLFSQTEDAKELKITASHFSMNVSGGRCECCQGTGLQKIDLNYLPNSYIDCPECGGKRFNEHVLACRYKGANIVEILETPINDIIHIFSDVKKLNIVLSNLIELGLGYLKLGQMSMNLSGGEAQRIKLAKALSTTSKGKYLYIFDEPTSGLNSSDIEKFESMLYALQEKGNTILVIEHNIEFIAKMSDYVIDFGTVGGDAGGKIVAQGVPRSVFQNRKSSLYDLVKVE